MKRSKKYKAVVGKVDPERYYTAAEAVKLAKEVSYTNFVGSLNMIVLLNVPSKWKNDSVRGSITLPNQTGKSKTVVVVAESKDHKAAAEADEVGGEELIKKIEGGYTDFDVLIATPEMMPKLARLGKVLGPKGLMPNPRNNTVTKDIEKVIKSYKSGKMDYKVDDQNSVKASVAKLDMTEEQLLENFTAFFEAVSNETRKYGPNRIKSVIVSPTMGPGIKLDTSSLLKE